MLILSSNKIEEEHLVSAYELANNLKLLNLVSPGFDRFSGLIKYKSADVGTLPTSKYLIGEMVLNNMLNNPFYKIVNFNRVNISEETLTTVSYSSCKKIDISNAARYFSYNIKEAIVRSANKMINEFTRTIDRTGPTRFSSEDTLALVSLIKSLDTNHVIVSPSVAALVTQHIGDFGIGYTADGVMVHVDMLSAIDFVIAVNEINVTLCNMVDESDENSTSVKMTFSVNFVLPKGINEVEYLRKYTNRVLLK